MLVVVSPAKRLNWTAQSIKTTTPIFSPEANRLAAHARQLSLGKLKTLMDLSDDLAKLNRDRFRDFANDPQSDKTRPALYAFAGDTYLGFDADSLDEGAQDYAQNHMRILSGLYGVLRPLDAIQPYRLEMGSRLKTRRGKSLYDFWGTEISKALNTTAEGNGSQLLVNCASQEYFGAVALNALNLRVITPQFYDIKNGPPKIVSFFAKKARGAMARFIVENRVKTVEGLKDFDLGGYKFVENAGDELIFHRLSEAVAA